MDPLRGASRWGGEGAGGGGTSGTTETRTPFAKLVFKLLMLIIKTSLQQILTDVILKKHHRCFASLYLHLQNNMVGRQFGTKHSMKNRSELKFLSQLAFSTSHQLTALPRS